MCNFSGHPKGICHSHYSANNFGGMATAILVPKTNAVTTTCFFHVGGFFTGMMAMQKCQTYYHVRAQCRSITTLHASVK